jgi:ribulose-phosphate 3-epimerase
MRIGAAIFNADHGRLAEELGRLEDGGIDFIHFDVYDGNFVSDLGFPPKTIETLRRLTKLPFEVHLGVTDPLRFVPALLDAGADRILSHIESMSLPYEALYRMKESGIEVGLALTLGTPTATVYDLLPMVDAVLLLSRVTGEGEKGAAFNPLVLERVTDLQARNRSAQAEPEIQVAGSVRKEHLRALAHAGAGAVALGGALYSATDMAAEVAEIRKAARIER